VGTLPANQFGTGRDAAVRFRATTAGCKTAAVTFTLHVDGPAWRQHTESVRDSLRAAIRGDVGLARLGDLVPVAKGKIEGDDLELREWDLTLKEINRHTDRLLAYFQPEGVFIQGVKNGGNAAAGGLSRYDILLRIDGEDIPDLAAALRVYQRASTLPAGKRKVLCEVLRGGYTRWFVLDFNRRSQEGAVRSDNKGSF